MFKSITRSRSRRAVGRLRIAMNRRFGFDGFALVALIALGAVLTAIGVVSPNVVPYTALVLPMLFGSIFLGPRALPWFVVLTLAELCFVLTRLPNITVTTLMRTVVVFVVGLVIVLASFRRSRLGVSGPRGESMFVDLRDRIRKQGQIPPLPSDWYVEAVTRSAEGTSFSGDFVVSGRSADGSAFDVVVVDVSGKGVEAGTRALLLSGAFGGLVSALPAGGFLPAANEFMVVQDWPEGFATAVHLHLELATGKFELRKAGHPPAVWLHAGSGRWSVLDSEGPVLGLIPGVEFEVVTGTMGAGDALLLYTDGLVETTTRDIASGIDRLAGHGQRLFQTGFDRGAHKLTAELGTRNDDTALLLVHRR